MAYNDGLQLRSPLEQCETVTVTTPSGGYTAGQMVKVEDVVMIAVDDSDAGDSAAMITKAPKVLVPCAAAATSGYAVGEKVYFDATNEEVTETASGNTLCGFVFEATSVGDEEGLINFNGDLGIVS